MITKQKTRYTDKQIFSQLNPLLGAWFKYKFGNFTEPQKYSIMSIHSRENVLVSAETGTGKTLSAFTAVLNELITLSEKDKLEDKVYCVYVSPLRALNNDIERNLLEPLEEIKKAGKKIKKKIDVRVAVRTGDTPASERAKMLRRSPHVLITTPETLAILLSTTKFKEKLKDAKWLIVDEIHALAPNKRGVHLSLSMERLQEIAPDICRIGLSATVAPVKEVAEYLVGMKDEKGKETRNCKIVDVSFLKKMDLKVISPLPDLVNVTQERIHNELYHLLDELIQAHRTTLVFTNTRAGTERVVHNLKDLFPERYSKGNIEAHHSSVSRELRLNVEQRLKEGKLKAVVSSTSLELGIDIGYVDLVVLIGSPKSIARAVQRIGRSGHRLHDKIKGRIIVLDRDDLIECSVLVKNALEKKIDNIAITENPLDVLAQQIYGIAIDSKRQIDDVWKLVRRSYCYRNLRRYDFNEVISYLSGEYSELELRHVYAKIWYDEETGEMGKRGKLARIIYMTNIGTIPDEARVKVKIKDQVIGSIDEAFLERLKKGDVFVLGGQSYVFRYASGMTAQVTAAFKRPPTVPSWVSEMLPLSFDLAVEIGKFRKLMEEKLKSREKKEVLKFIKEYLYIDGHASQAVYSYFNQQYQYAEIPNHRKLLVETYNEGGTKHIIFHSLYGRRVNDALSRAYGFALSKLMHKDVEIVMADNGFVISSVHKVPLDKAFTAVKSDELRKLLAFAINDSEVLSRRFRHCAARALMILRSYKGKRKTAGRQQMSARLLLAAIKRISNDFSILREARREVMEDLMDIEHAEEVVKGIEKGKISVNKITTTLPSPFAFGLLMQGKAEVMKMEDRLSFVKRMHEQVEEQIRLRR